MFTPGTSPEGNTSFPDSLPAEYNLSDRDFANAAINNEGLPEKSPHDPLHTSEPETSTDASEFSPSADKIVLVSPNDYPNKQFESEVASRGISLKAFRTNEILESRSRNR